MAFYKNIHFLGNYFVPITVFTDGPFFSYDGEEQMDGASITVNTSETDDVSIICNVTATNPILTFLNLTSRPIASNVYFDNGTISITSATVDNAGNYTCTADNGVTTPTNINFILVVNADPTIASEFTISLTKHLPDMNYHLLTEKVHIGKEISTNSQVTKLP